MLLRSLFTGAALAMLAAPSFALADENTAENSLTRVLDQIDFSVQLAFEPR